MYRIMRIVLLGVFCCTAAVIIAFGYVSIVHGQKNPKANRLGQNKIDVHDFNPQVVLGPQPPIVNPPFVRAGEALDKIQPNELVLGVVVDGAARAYPINMLTGPSREIFNDNLAGRSIAATW